MPQKIYDFERIIARKGTDSIKWSHFPGDVLPLWVADMDFAVLPEIIDAVQNRLSHPVFGYADEDYELKEIICTWITHHYNWQVKPEDILIMTGVVKGLNVVAHSLATGADHIAFLTPIYPPFFKISEFAECKRIELPLIEGKNHYEIDFDMFSAQITDKVKVFYLCNPHNPVGRVFSQQELERIGSICLEKKILICSDEIHCDLIYPGNKHIPIASLSPELAKTCVTLMAPSKTFNIPSLHFSFAVIQEETLRNKIQRLCKGLVGSPDLLAIAAAKSAYLSGEEWLEQVVQYLHINRDFLMNFIHDRLPQISINQPQGTYLAWLDCRQMADGDNAYQIFLDKAKVALNDGIHFGESGKGFVRLNFGCSKLVLEKALHRIESVFSS